MSPSTLPSVGPWRHVADSALALARSWWTSDLEDADHVDWRLIERLGDSHRSTPTGEQHHATH